MILVTGGTGLVGAHLLLHLANNEEKAIRAIYRTSSSIEKTKKLFLQHKKEDLFLKIEWVEADITDIPSLEKAFQNIQTVYHCAAKISFDPCDEKSLRKTNIEGTANIVNFCIDKKAEKLCYVSSIATLGDAIPPNKYIHEESEWNPNSSHSDYSITKYGAEMEVWRGQQEGLKVIIVNPGVILGSTIWKDGSGEIFNNAQKKVLFYTNGITGFVAVRDVVRIMFELMKSEIVNEKFILVADNKSYKEILFQIAEKTNSNFRTIEVKPWMLSIAWRLNSLASLLFNTPIKLSKYSSLSLQNQKFFDNSKIKNALNFDFQSTEDCVQKTLLEEV